MKFPTSKLLLVSSLFAVAGVFAIPSLRADEKADEAAAKKAKHEAKMLEKYDTNHDGKLDDTEKAAMQADKEKMKAEHAAKKKEREEKKADQDSK